MGCGGRNEGGGERIGGSQRLRRGIWVCRRGGDRCRGGDGEVLEVVDACIEGGDVYSLVGEDVESVLRSHVYVSQRSSRPLLLLPFPMQ